jgi:hypothetical protein
MDKTINIPAPMIQEFLEELTPNESIIITYKQDVKDTVGYFEIVASAKIIDLWKAFH